MITPLFVLGLRFRSLITRRFQIREHLPGLARAPSIRRSGRRGEDDHASTAIESEQESVRSHAERRRREGQPCRQSLHRSGPVNAPHRQQWTTSLLLFFCLSRLWTLFYHRYRRRTGPFLLPLLRLLLWFDHHHHPSLVSPLSPVIIAQWTSL